MRVRKEQIPDLLSYSRLVMILPLLVISYLQMRTVFLIAYAFTLLTDFFDGQLARRWKPKELLGHKGAAADSIADFALGIASIPMLAFLAPDLILHYLPALLGVASYALLVRAYGIYRTKSLAGLHMVSGKITMGLLTLTVLVSVYLMAPNLLIPLSLVAVMVSFTEEGLVRLLHGDAHPDTLSIFDIRLRENKEE